MIIRVVKQGRPESYSQIFLCALCGDCAADGWVDHCLAFCHRCGNWHVRKNFLDWIVAGHVPDTVRDELVRHVRARAGLS